MTAWDDLSSFDPRALGEARLQAHHALQWVTCAARANLMPMPGDSETNLGWDRARGALVSHTLRPHRGEALQIGLQIETMTLTALRGNEAIDQFALEGERHSDAGRWLDHIAMNAGLALPSGATMTYAIPAHPVGDGARYSCAAHHADFTALARWFAAADAVLRDIRDALPPGVASPVRCWPHHFDIATLWTLGDGDAETAPSVNVGMCPGDGYYAQPYFYVSPWPRPALQRLPPLPSPGDWHTQDFIAAILTGDQIIAMKDRAAEMRRFLDAAIAGARNLALQR